MAGGGSGLGKPVLAASAAFLAGAFLGCSASRDAALALGVAALVCALHARVRFAALGLALGLLRGASHEQPATFALPDEFEGTVVSDGVVRTSGVLIVLRLRGVEVHRGDVSLLLGLVHLA